MKNIDTIVERVKGRFKEDFCIHLPKEDCNCTGRHEEFLEKEIREAYEMGYANSAESNDYIIGKIRVKLEKNKDEGNDIVSIESLLEAIDQINENISNL